MVNCTRIVASTTLTSGKTAPFPLFRWAAGIGILIWTATGSAPHSISGWFTAHLPWLIVAGALALAPEVVRIEFGGMNSGRPGQDVCPVGGYAFHGPRTGKYG